jgi:heptosyltransferase-2
MNLVERLGYPVKDKKYRFFVTESNLQEAENLLSSNGVDLTNDYLIALHPGANWRPKRWPQTYYAKLIDLLLSSNKRNYKIIITGEKEDKELASNIKERVKRNVNKVVDLCGQTTLGSLAGVFSYCKSLVSGDTGALHIGCALKADPSLNRDDLDVYCVGLFGPTCSNLTGPLNGHYKIIEGTRKDTCQVPCYDYTCRDYVCMNSILPQKVADTIEDI